MSLKISPILPKQQSTAKYQPANNKKTVDATKQTNQAINRLALKFGGDDETKPQKKTVDDFYRDLLKKDTLKPKDANKMFEIEFSVGKSPQKASVEDYRKAFDTKLLTIAGYKMFDEREIGLARNLMKTDDSWTLKSIGSRDAKDGRQDGTLKVGTSKYSLEHAKIVGQAVLQFREYESKLNDENKAKAESETNQMLLDPIRLGFNTPVNWLERTLNTPRDLLQQADKAELTPFSSTAKYIGKSIAEKIVGKEVPEMPTFSQNVKDLTGIELPSIPEVKLPRPFEYQTEKYKREAKIGEDLGATAIDLFLLKRGLFGKPSVTPESIGNLNLSKVFRVQGGELPKASKFRMFIGNEGKMVVKGKDRLFVTFDDFNRVKVFQAENRLGKAEVISFEVKTSFVQQIRKFAVIKDEGKKFPNLPQIADETKTNSSFGLPIDWIKQLKNSAIKGTGKIEPIKSPTNYNQFFTIPSAVNLTTPNSEQKKP
jgi:hypothetical protein